MLLIEFARRKAPSSDSPTTACSFEQPILTPLVRVGMQACHCENALAPSKAVRHATLLETGALHKSSAEIMATTPPFLAG